MNNGVIILSYCEIDELHLLFLPLKPWLTQCSSALCTADPCIPHAAGTQALELGHHRHHSACSKVEARTSSKCYREFSEADQSYEKLFGYCCSGFGWFFFFFLCLFCFFFLLQSVKGDTEPLSEELLGQTHRLSSPALHSICGDSEDYSTSGELRHISMTSCTLSTHSFQVQQFGHNLQVSV